VNQKHIERRALIVTLINNLVITGLGLWVFSLTNIQALFLDFFFSLIALISTVLAIAISKISKKRTKSYPDGLYYLEPLYALLKSLLTLSLLVVSVVGTSASAYEYFAHGTGSPINIGPILPFTIVLVVLCFGLGFFNKAQNKKINYISTILSAESKTNFIDGIQSLGIGVAIIFLNMTDINSALGFLHYTGDFFITVVLVFLSLKEPIKVFITSFKELSGGTTDDNEVKRNVNKVLTTNFTSINEIFRSDVYKVGMHIKVRISLLSEVKQDTLQELIIARQKTIKELRKTYDSFEVDFVF
jgi:divalent metal cation (Fe/Co/Zn/Cd) transporter